MYMYVYTTIYMRRARQQAEAVEAIIHTTINMG